MMSVDLVMQPKSLVRVAQHLSMTLCMIITITLILHLDTTSLINMLAKKEEKKIFPMISMTFHLLD